MDLPKNGILIFAKGVKNLAWYSTSAAKEKTDVFPVSQLASESLIKLKTDREISRFLDGLPVQYEVSSDNTILSMVESGIGISVMHGLMQESNRYKVLWKPLSHTEKRDIAIATAKDIRLSAAATLFVEHVCSEIQ